MINYPMRMLAFSSALKISLPFYDINKMSMNYLLNCYTKGHEFKIRKWHDKNVPFSDR